MTPESFADHFHILADAPNGIQKLREMILQLAVQGKLVSQNPKDEPASVLLEKIRAQKEKLVKDGTIKKQKPLPPVNPDEVPYELPGGWEWVRFGEATINRDGERVPVSKEERRYRQGQYDYYGASGAIDKIDDFLFEKPLLLIGEDGANLINRATPIAFIAYGKYWVNNHAHVLDGISLEFLLYVALHINAIDLKPYVTGTAQPKMNQAKMNSILIALPPLPEQKRIVAKVNHLMALCDDLETRQQKRNKIRITLNGSCLNALTSPDGDSVGSAWNRIRENFDLLYDCPENVTALRQSILQLAVQGKLVPQNPKDEPASVLLEKIKAKKEKLVKEGKIKKQKPLPPIDPDELPYELPGGWEWATLHDAGEVNPRNDTPDDLVCGFIPMTLVSDKYGAYPQFETRNWKEVKKSFTHFAEGDVAFAKITPCFQNSKSAVLRDIPNGVGAGTTELHVFRPVGKTMVAEYVWIYFKSPRFLREGIARMTGSAGQKRVPKAYIEANPFPLPPLAEQKRIVAKVDQLLALCDDLEAKLSQSQDDAERLMGAVVNELVAA